MTWFGFGAVFLLFFLTHSIPVRPGIKSRITTKVGTRGFAIGYSVLSLCALSLLVWSAAEAPYVQLWPQMMWHRQVVHIGMLGVCLIVAFSVGRPNPFSFGGANNSTFDPKRSGIVRLSRHPILLVLVVWAGLHLLPNGDLAHVLLFGVLGSFAIAGRGLINRRKRREMGSEKWNSLNKSVAAAPMAHAPQSWRATVLRFAAGILLFVALIALHPVLIGVSAI